ncbi:hypothetical protein [Streptomyces melanosporofaciens]|uniref:Small secreted domain n=1 Tax=Streptomyces melanosporofaciens TaxID=67327 RepID=A0A1H5C0E6_STRMJ|nr:hypothetical protein [Streptomyces melanosporofaciens]SED59941.1 hypothetical protein SAMN04490356_9148 [Streptomyces melanosporofaciens]
MQIAKKAALLAATASTLVLLGTGTATAYGNGGGSDRGADVPTSVNLSSFIFQTNDCDTSTGTTLSTAGAAPSGEIGIGSTCINSIGG